MRIFSILALSLLSSQAMACGGDDLEDLAIKSGVEVKLVIENVKAVYGKTVTVTDIVRSQNNILNLDKEVVATAKCRANFINVFLETKSKDLRCKFSFDGARNGLMNVNDREIRSACQLKGKKQELLVTRI